MNKVGKKNFLYKQTNSLLLPALVICFLMWFVPFGYQFYLSLLNYNLNDPSTLNTFNGLSNYKTAISNDPFFVNSLLRTISFTFVCLGLEMLLGLIGALILIELEERFAQKLLAFIIIPMVIAPSAVGLTWYFQFNPNFGPLSIYLQKAKLMDNIFLGKEFAFFSVSLVDIWQFTPFMLIIFYSGLKSIPKSVRESLIIDNISYPLKLRKIYLRYILPLFIIAIFLRGVGLIKIFDTIYVLTGGGPGELTEMFSLYAHRLNYKEFNFGLGASQGVLVNYGFLILFLFVYRKLKVY